MLKLLRVTTSALALAFCSASAAFAAQELIIKTDQTQLINVSGNPGAVVIGNPSIADATVHGDKVFVHGRAYGSTNLIILDQDGNQLASMAKWSAARTTTGDVPVARRHRARTGGDRKARLCAGSSLAGSGCDSRRR